MRISDWSSDVCSSDLRESVRALSADRGQALFRRRLHCQLSAARRYHHRSDQARRRLAAGGQCRLYEVLEEIEDIAVLNGHPAASSGKSTIDTPAFIRSGHKIFFGPDRKSIRMNYS